MAKKVIVTGSGFAGLSAASFMAKAGWEVVVIEKHATAGGRARQLQEQGFSFDMGPSWYWMPEIFDRYFQLLGKTRSQFYQITRLDPSYRVYWQDDYSDVPAGIDGLKAMFDALDPGSSVPLEKFLREAALKYSIGMEKLVYKPGLSMSEFVDADFLQSLFRLDVFTSVRKHVRKYFKHAKLQQLLEFPVLFLGASPAQIPALYTLMNYADMVGGTWYPEGGMYAVVKAMQQTASELGVQFQFNENVTQIDLAGDRVCGVVTDKQLMYADAVIVAADYQHAEQHWLPPEYRSYSEKYWNSRVMAPSCLLYYVGIDKKLTDIRHHNLFFDASFDAHAADIYQQPRWPEHPMFYLNVVSATDASVAPPGCENLFILIPVAAGLSGDTDALREHYLQDVLSRLEQRLGEKISEHVIYKKCFSVSDFVREYNAFRGNAYGLANILSQTAIFKPSCRSKKLPNLFYTGQLTVPGPGVPPSLISGEIVAAEVVKHFKDR